MKSQKSRSVYFPGLHGLRFFAALAVVVSHVELLKQYHGYPNAAEQPAIDELGRLAVTFFFVLSGFLITFLLLVEKETHGSIAVGKFYLRRILRIWPLYYLTVFVVFVVLPRFPALDIPQISLSTDLAAKATLFLLFLPQVALSLYQPVPYGEPLWSIGVEEQFYLVWPLLIGRVRRVLPLLLFFCFGGVIVKQAAIMYARTLHDPQRLVFWNHFIDYFYFNRFECMAIGGLAAWLLSERKQRILTFLWSWPVQVAVYALTAYGVLTSRGKPLLHYAHYSVLFAVIILNVATNERTLLRLRHPAFTFLGNISYSMYLLHEIVIGVLMRALPAGSNALLYAGSIVGTILLSAITYRYYELWFLRRKARLAVIASGPVGRL